MSEAVFGFIGVLIGAALPWVKDWLSDKQKQKQNARYLAIRTVCILDKYVDDCVQVIGDDGFCEGQRMQDGSLEPQVSQPAAPQFPEDIDWKSIDHNLMYSLLALPNEADCADRSIQAAGGIACPPDYEEFFEERQHQYAILGLKALDLSARLRTKYGIPLKEQNGWDPKQYLLNKKTEVEQERIAQHQRAVLFEKELMGTA